MSKEGPYRDQAERLRKKVEKNRDVVESKLEKEVLPPRSRHHNEKKKKSKWKVKYPVIRLLALLFILLPIAIFSTYNYLQKNGAGGAEKASTQNGFETIGFEDENKDKGTVFEEKKDGEDNEEKIESEGKQEKEPTIPAPKDSVANDSGDKGTAIPSDSEEVKKEEDKQSTDKTDVVYHTVKPNETIFRIAMNYYQSQSGIDIIRKANNLKSNEIQAGQVLMIPKK